MGSNFFKNSSKRWRVRKSRGTRHQRRIIFAVSLISPQEMESSSQDSQTTTKWTCPACHSDYSSNSNKRRHLQHCSFLKERMEEGMPADEIERLIEGFFDELTTKTERCTCEAGYTFCHNIISDINWDAELFVVTVHTSQGPRKFARYFSYYFFSLCSRVGDGNGVCHLLQIEIPEG